MRHKRQCLNTFQGRRKIVDMRCYLREAYGSSIRWCLWSSRVNKWWWWRRRRSHNSQRSPYVRWMVAALLVSRPMAVPAATATALPIKTTMVLLSTATSTSTSTIAPPVPPTTIATTSAMGMGTISTILVVITASIAPGIRGVDWGWL